MKSNLIRTIILFSLLAGSIFLCSSSSELRLEEGRGVDMDGNWTVDGYIIENIEPSKVEKEQLPEDTTFVKKSIYSIKSEGRQGLSATIVLSGADSRSIHRPEVCLPGQGWEILSRKPVKVQLETGEISVMELLLERKDTVKGGGERVIRAVYSYWLVGKDVVTPHTWKRILISNWDNLIYNKAHRWAYPSFMSSYVVKGDSTDVEMQTKTKDYVYDMIKKITPQFLEVELK